MKYMGSKARIAKEILPIILKDRKPEQWYVEPFVGGGNSIDKVEGLRMGNDVNKYLIALLKAVIGQSVLPEFITKERRFEILKNKANFPDWLVGYAGFICGFGGDFNGGFAGTVKTKIGTFRNYQKEALNNVQKQAPFIADVIFTVGEYDKMPIPENSIIYCDPPYKSTTDYKTGFNHSAFWEWVRVKKSEGHSVFVSEYEAPEDFVCVWSKEVKSSLSANGKSGGNKNSVEKLFTL